MAVILDQSGDPQYLQAADTASLRTPSSAITITAWVRFPSNDGSAFGSVVHKRYSNGNPYVSYSIDRSGVSARRYYFAINISGGYADTEISQGGESIAQLSADTWYFFVATRAGGAPLRIDVYDTDGELVTTADTNNTSEFDTLYTAEPLWVGRSNYDGFPLYWQGRLTGLFIHDAILSAGDRADLFDATIPLISDEPHTALPVTPSADFWPLDFNGRGTVNGNDFTLFGDVEFTISRGLEAVAQPAQASFSALSGAEVDVTLDAQAAPATAAFGGVVLQVADLDATSAAAQAEFGAAVSVAGSLNVVAAPAQADFDAESEDGTVHSDLMAVSAPAQASFDALSLDPVGADLFAAAAPAQALLEGVSAELTAATLEAVAGPARAAFEADPARDDLRIQPVDVRPRRGRLEISAFPVTWPVERS